ncbi:hypothetical protein IMSAG049_01396 [Clostridiales bacterium]|nr:hypothetical protein IMSAG049_01396 [Clostridiales bacterium]
MLNVSTTLVREAFRTLEAENLHIHNPYSGVTVAEITPKYLVDICEMCEMLDKCSADLIISNVNDEDIQYLNSIIIQLRELNPEIIHMENPEESEKFIKIEAGFHIYLSHITKNFELENIMRGLLKKAHIFRLMLVATFSNTNHMEETIEELNNMVLAIENRNKAAYINAVSNHYARSISENMELLKILKETSGDNL